MKNVWRWPSHASRKWRDAVNSNLRAFAAELKRTGLSKRVVAIHLLGYNDGQFGVVGVDTSVHARRDYVDYCREQAKTGGTTNYVNFCRLLGVRAVDEEGDIVSDGYVMTKIVSLERLAQKEAEAAAAKVAQ